VSQIDLDMSHLDDINESNASDHENVISDYVIGREAEEDELQNGLAFFSTSSDPSTFDEA